MKMNTYGCVHAAAKLEGEIQEIYTALAGIYASDPTLSGLFRRLAEEERQHALRVELLFRHQRKADWKEDVVERTTKAIEAAAASIAAVRKELSGSFLFAEPVVVLQTLMEMEVRLDAINARELVKSADPEVQKLFATMAGADAAHKELSRVAAKLAAPRTKG